MRMVMMYDMMNHDDDGVQAILAQAILAQAKRSARTDRGSSAFKADPLPVVTYWARHFAWEGQE
eukprot:10424546-Karenia_brevis.AAC.1